MTPTRTYKIIDHFKAGKCVMTTYGDSHPIEMKTLTQLFYYLRYAITTQHSFSFRLINKKGRRG